jgi:hypothetical protein
VSEKEAQIAEQHPVYVVRAFRIRHGLC